MIVSCFLDYLCFPPLLAALTPHPHTQFQHTDREQTYSALRRSSSPSNRWTCWISLVSKSPRPPSVISLHMPIHSAACSCLLNDLLTAAFHPHSPLLQITMRRILGLLLLSQATVAFLPRCPVPAATPNAQLASTAARLEPLSALGGGGEYDLFKGSGGVSKVSKDPAPGEFDLLGGKAQEDAVVIKEVRCVWGIR